MPDAFTTESLRWALGRLKEKMAACAGELNELDGALGDGDLGVTVQLACGAMAAASQSGQQDDVGLMLATLGMEGELRVQALG